MSNGIVLPRHRKILDKVKAEINSRPCTCHPDDNPPVPCAKKYALSYCQAVMEGRSQAYAEFEEMVISEQGNFGDEWSCERLLDAIRSKANQ